MRTSSKDVIAWLNTQAGPKGKPVWRALCLKSSRMAWNLPVLAPDANAWWRSVAHKHRHETLPKDVPAGAMCYAPIGKWGHAFIADGHGGCYSTDFYRRGRIDHVKDGALTAWTHRKTVLWTDHTPDGHPLPVG
jgi:hypothetical protein